MKKITILNEHLGTGGIENYVSSLTRMLEQDYEIELIIKYKLKEQPSYPISNKVKITYLLDKGLNKDGIKKAFKRRKPIDFLIETIKYLKVLILKRCVTKKSIKNLQTDYLITTRLYETKLANKLLKQSDIVKIATDHSYPNKKHKRKVIKATTRFERLVVSNDEIKEIYSNEIGEKVVSISDFLDVISEKTTPLRNKNIISVGTFKKEKDFLTLLDIMALIVREDSEVTLTLIGDGKESKKIKNKIKELKLESNVELTGFLSIAEIEEKMLKSCIFVMTSKEESFGISLLEAMSVGLPIVAFDSSSGARTLLEDKTGVLISERNNEKFARTVLRILNSKKEINDLSKKSKEKVNDYTAIKVINKWKRLLEESTRKSNKKVMFISSTGGHLNEMLMLKSMFKKYPFMLVTENTPSNKSLQTKYGKRNVKYLIYGTRKHIITYPFKLFTNCFKSLYFYLKFRPKYIVTTGAHTAGPMCSIGKIFRSKIIYIETFANSETKTVTGNLIYKFADLFIVQWESMLKLYDKAIYGGWIY